MTYYDETLRGLQAKSQRKKHLSVSLEEMKKQKKPLEQKLKLLKISAYNEEVDVYNLENKNLTSIFLDLIGKKESKLEKERAEELAARLKRDAAQREFDDLVLRITNCESELATLECADEQYRTALDEKLLAIKKSGKADADHILVLGERIAICDNQIREVDEALDIAENAKDFADEALSELDSAENWGTYDIFGGGLATNIAKHDHIGNADLCMKNLKKELLKLKTELCDVEIDADVEIVIDGFTEYVDFFIDNIFTDLEVLEQIKETRKSVENTFGQIKELIKKLNDLKMNIVLEKAKFQLELDRLA